MDVIEAKMGGMLFDRNSLVNVDDYDVGRGVVSEGTAVDGLGQIASFICGTVEPLRSNIALGGSPDDVDQSYDEYGVNFGPLVIHIGQGDPNGCTNGQDLNEIAVHEFMHTLGMDTHFQGFGIGPIYNDEFELNIEKRVHEQE
jgi:hypothetical protein